MATLALKNIYKIYEDEVTAVSNFTHGAYAGGMHLLHVFRCRLLASL